MQGPSSTRDRYLVTGAAGFVGSFLVNHLTDRGIAVRAMVRREPETWLTGLSGVEVVQADLKDAESLRRAVDGIAGVYHIAALFRQAGLPESEFMEVNAEGTRRLLEASIEAGVSRLIHCSTVGVHGHVENPPADESCPIRPGDMYQRSKVAGERIAMEYFRGGRIGGVVIRPAMIWGPTDRRTLKLFRMVARRRFFYVGPGDATVHFIDVRDLANAFRLAMEAGDRNAEVYIIPGRQPVALRQVVGRIAKRVGVPEPGIHLPVRPMQWLGTACEAVCTPLRIQPPIFRRRVDFFTKSRHFDGGKARRELGFEPAADLDSELDDIVESYRQEGLL